MITFLNIVLNVYIIWGFFIWGYMSCKESEYLGIKKEIIKGFKCLFFWPFLINEIQK